MNMHSWEQIQKTIDYIEEHTDEKIEIEQLAEMAALSPFYYQRLFKRLVKKPVAEYIRLRRMAKAVELLPLDDRRILDIALELGFSSHEHFTRNFKETFGMTPTEYRGNPQALNRMTKPELLLQYALIDEGVPLITDGIILEINRRQVEEPIRYIGFKGSYPVELLSGFGTESGVDPLAALWDNLHALKEKADGVFADDEELGVTLPDEPGRFSYFAGGKANGNAGIANGAEWVLPSGEYLVCNFEAENFEALVMDALYKAVQYIYNMWLPNHKMQTESFCAEIYPSHNPQATKMELWLKILPQNGIN